MDFVVRTARPEDAESIARVRVASWQHAYAHLLSAEYLDALDPLAEVDGWRGSIERFPARRHEDDRWSFAVAEADGVVVGFAIAGPPREAEPPRDLELALLYQDSRMHGSGSGQALLDAALGARPAYLWVAEDNPRAFAFYRRNGFRPDGARKLDERWEDLPEIRLVR